jgi:serine/threonine protein kinase
MQKYSIPLGFTLVNNTPLFSDTDSVTIHCRRNADSKDVALKFPVNDSTKDWVATQIEQDHKASIHIRELLGELFAKRFWNSFGIVEHNNVKVLVKEYNSSAMTLERYITKERRNMITNTEFLNLALKMVKLVGDIHKCNVVLANVTPESFTYEPKSGEVRLLDFGSCEILSAKCNFVPFSPHAVNFERTQDCLYVSRTYLSSSISYN